MRKSSRGQMPNAQMPNGTLPVCDSQCPPPAVVAERATSTGRAAKSRGVGWPPPPLASARHRNPRSLDRGEPRPRAPPAPVPISLAARHADRALAPARPAVAGSPPRPAPRPPERRHRGGDRASLPVGREARARASGRPDRPDAIPGVKPRPFLSGRSSRPFPPSSFLLGPSETIAIDPPTDDRFPSSSPDDCSVRQRRQVPA